MTPADAFWIADVIDDWDCTSWWNIAGGAASPDMLSSRLWDGVAAQHTVQIGPSTPALLQLVDLDLLDGVGQVEMLIDPRWASPLTETLRTFVARAFRDFPLRSLLLSAPGHAIGIADCVTPLATTTVRLPGHHRRRGHQRSDLVIHQLRHNDPAVRVARPGAS